MRNIILLVIFLLPFVAEAQSDVLILERRGKHLRTYATGDYLVMETIYHQWFQGGITAIRHDSVFFGGLSFHIHEIATVQGERVGSGLMLFGTGMLVTSGGILVLGAVNGLYRHDKSGKWYTTSGLITAGALAVTGLILRKSYIKKYPLGGKYKLQYLTISFK